MARSTRCLIALLLLAACADPAGPARDCDDDHIRYSSISGADVAQAFLDSLATGRGQFHVAGPLVLPYPIDLAQHVTTTNRIVFTCAPGWQGQIIGQLRLTKTIFGWELESIGCAWHHASLHAEYLQESEFVNSIFHTFDLTIDHSTHVLFERPYIYDTRITMLDAGQVRMNGGMFGSSNFKYRGTTGVNGWAGPVTWQHGHAEHSVIDIEGAESANVTFNYFINMNVRVHARKAFVAYNDWLASIYNGGLAGCT